MHIYRQFCRLSRLLSSATISSSSGSASPSLIVVAAAAAAALTGSSVFLTSSYNYNCNCTSFNNSPSSVEEEEDRVVDVDDDNSAAAASVSTGVCDGNTDTNQRTFRILVVGMGLTGCLTAYRIRERYEALLLKSKVHNYNHNHNANPGPSTTNIEIHIVDRASYPAGRFGALARFNNNNDINNSNNNTNNSNNNHTNSCTNSSSIANIGAQVLSIVNPYDPRSRGDGHGITYQDVKLAYRIVQKFVQQKLVQLLPNSVLRGDTCERMIWENLWYHYGTTSNCNEDNGGGGMSGVLWYMLTTTIHPTTIRFNTRIDSVRTCSRNTCIPNKNKNLNPNPIPNKNNNNSSSNNATTTINSNIHSTNTNATMMKVKGVTRKTTRSDQQQNQQPRPKQSNSSSSFSSSLLNSYKCNNCSSDSNSNDEQNNIVWEELYDCVVLCNPVPDVVRMLVDDTTTTTNNNNDMITNHNNSNLSNDAVQVLRNVQYDSRICEAHFYDSSLRPYLEHIFRASTVASLNANDVDADDVNDDANDDDDADDDDDNNKNSNSGSGSSSSSSSINNITNDQQRINELNVEHLGTGIEYISWQDRYHERQQQQHNSQHDQQQQRATVVVAHGLPKRQQQEQDEGEKGQREIDENPSSSGEVLLVDATLCTLLTKIAAAAATTTATEVQAAMPTSGTSSASSLSSSRKKTSIATTKIKLNEQQISSKRLYMKSINWKTSQMMVPMEAIIADPPTGATSMNIDSTKATHCAEEEEENDGYNNDVVEVESRWQCITSKDGALIIAGDFMTQSSFLGCVASADAAARAVLRQILQ